MVDQNNCSSCDYKKINIGPGWCYMFEEEPTSKCMQHSSLKKERSKNIGRIASLSYGEITMMTDLDIENQIETLALTLADLWRSSQGNPQKKLEYELTLTKISQSCTVLIQDHIQKNPTQQNVYLNAWDATCRMCDRVADRVSLILNTAEGTPLKRGWLLFNHISILDDLSSFDERSKSEANDLRTIAAQLGY